MRKTTVYTVILITLVLLATMITSCTTATGETTSTQTSSPVTTTTEATTTSSITTTIAITLTTPAKTIPAETTTIKTSPTVTTTAASPVQTIKDITVAEAFKLVNENVGNPNFIIVDVRTADEYATGHLANAINVDFYQDFSANIGKLDRNKTYLIYCRTGVRSSGARDIMKSLGFLKIYNMDVDSSSDPGNTKGGINNWISSGYPVVK
jgi:rhodanese-related sulfurtransferase